MSTQSQAPQPSEPPRDERHTLPRWISWIQDNLFLSFLLLAEAYLLGTLMSLGWVRDLEDPASWGYFGGVGVVLFFAAGAMAAGVALRCSVTAAAAFREHRWGFALFNFTGLLIFAAAEIWASLSERSANLRPTPADSAVLHLMGVASLPVSPTVVVVALLLPFATLYWGFSQRQNDAPVRQRESAEDRARRHQAELEESRHKAEVRTVRVGGIRAAAVAAFGKAPTDEPIVADNVLDNAADADGDGGDGGGIAADNSRTRAGNTRREPYLRLTPAPRRPRGLLTASDLASWVQEHLGRTITDEAALNLVKTIPGAVRLDDVKGQPWAAPKTLLIQRARQLWAEVPADKAREA